MCSIFDVRNKQSGQRTIKFIDYTQFDKHQKHNWYRSSYMLKRRLKVLVLASGNSHFYFHGFHLCQTTQMEQPNERKSVLALDIYCTMATLRCQHIHQIITELFCSTMSPVVASFVLFFGVSSTNIILFRSQEKNLISQLKCVSVLYTRPIEPNRLNVLSCEQQIY